MRARLAAVAGLLGFVLAAALLFRGVFALLDQAGRQRTPSRGLEGRHRGHPARRDHVRAHRTARSPARRSTPRPGRHQICFQALEHGAIDLYPEYTGTGLTAILQRPASTDRAQVFSTVRREFSQRWSSVWLPPLAFNNTYALVVRAATTRRLGIMRISDLARHPELRAGFTAEFLGRRDGYPGLEKRYGIHFREAPRSMEAGLMYSALAEGSVDVISAYRTDARIDKLGLSVLLDDRHFFPPYQAAPLVRHATLLAHPELTRVLGVLGGRLDDAHMRRLNAEVDIHGKNPRDVARAFVATLPP